MLSTDSTPVSASSSGAVTSRSTASGEAPSYCAVTKAWGSSSGGKSSCLRVEVPMTPKTAAQIVMRAMRARLRRLRRVRESTGVLLSEGATSAMLRAAPDAPGWG